MKTCPVTWILVLGLAALPASGQASPAATSQQPSQQPAQKPPQKAKKVWTNEDLESMSPGSPVSTASATSAAAPAEGTEAAQPGEEKSAAKPKVLQPDQDPKVYREKLDALRKQLDDLDAKIKSTQDAMDGSKGGSNAINLNQPTPTLRPEDQLAGFEKQRQSVLQQIEDLETKAKQNGISPGEIR